jgi:hypothetical protein
MSVSLTVPAVEIVMMVAQDITGRIKDTPAGPAGRHGLGATCLTGAII